MPAPRGNPNAIKGGKSINPSGKPLAARLAAKTLAIACREAASDEEIAEWLLEIASGRWPDIRPDKPKRGGNPDATPIAIDMSSPPDGAHRMAALKEFLLRRDGQPMQSVVLKADIEARARRIDNASDAISFDDWDPIAAGALEVALTRAIGSANTEGAIDVQSVEVPDAET